MGRTRRFAAVCALAVVVGGCGLPAPAPAVPAAPPSVVRSDAPSAPVAPSPTPPPLSSTTTTTAPVASSAQQAVDAADATVTRGGADVGIAVLDRRTGTLATNDAGATAFNSASLSKVLTIVDALTGPTTVTDADRRSMQAALGPSDDDAMNTLWSRFGGQAGITRVIDTLGLQDTTVPDDASQWGEVQLSPRDMTTVLRFVVEGLAPADRDFVLDALGAAPGTGADGFDQAFGLLEPARRGATEAKQGWLCCLGDRVDLHSAGFPTADDRYAVAILSRQPYGYPAARQVLDDAAAAVRDALGA